jgi:hypothetical protein
MRRAHEKSSSSETGAQAPENPTGATSTGTTSGAGSTGTYARGTEPETAYRRAPAEEEERAGGLMGGSLAILAGLIAFLAGLAVVVRPSYYAVINNYAYAWNGRPWGIILLILGALLFASGAAALLGIGPARAVGVGLAVLTALAGFLWLVYSPVWGIVIVALSVFAIWGLIHDAEYERM